MAGNICWFVSLAALVSNPDPPGGRGGEGGSGLKTRAAVQLEPVMSPGGISAYRK